MADAEVRHREKVARVERSETRGRSTRCAEPRVSPAALPGLRHSTARSMDLATCRLDFDPAYKGGRSLLLESPVLELEHHGEI